MWEKEMKYYRVFEVNVNPERWNIRCDLAWKAHLRYAGHSLSLSLSLSLFLSLSLPPFYIVPQCLVGIYSKREHIQIENRNFIMSWILQKYFLRPERKCRKYKYSLISNNVVTSLNIMLIELWLLAFIPFLEV